MATKEKRKLDHHFSVSTQPSAKRAKIDSFTGFDKCSILNSERIKDEILDYLPVESHELLMCTIANHNYFQRRLCLPKQDALKLYYNVKDNLNQLDFQNICVLFSNFKAVLPEKNFRKLLQVKFTMGRFDDDIMHNIDCFSLFESKMIPQCSQDEQKKYLFAEVSIVLKEPRDISNIFNDSQKKFIENNRINLQNLTEFTFQVPKNTSTDEKIKYEILVPMTKDSHTSHYCFLGLTVNPTVIEMVPIFLNSSEIHTNTILDSIRRIILVPHPNMVEEHKTFDVFIDHNLNVSQLEILAVGKSNMRFTVNIHCNQQPNIVIENLSINVVVTWHDLESRLKFTDEEINFINNCRREDANFQINKVDICFRKGQIFGNHLLFVRLFGDEYYFEWKNTFFICRGASICELSPDRAFPNSIKTSDIPQHWRIMEFGGAFTEYEMIMSAGTFPEHEVDVEIDGFSENIEWLSITKKNIGCPAGLDWHLIPKQMKFIRLPYDDYLDLALEVCCFMTDPPEFHPNLDYKKVEIRFPDTFFKWNDEEQCYDEMFEEEFTKCINPIFDVKLDGEIIVFHKNSQ
eukprot:281949_1